jgi:hypothetical protein
VSVAVHANDTDTEKVASVMATGGKDHFVTVKGTGDVILVATTNPANQCANLTWEADGATITSPAVGTDKCTAKVSRGTSQKIPVRIKCGGNTLWEGIVWVVWSTGAPPAAFGYSVVAGAVATNDGTSGPGMGIQLDAARFTFTITPAAIITDADIPDLRGAATIAVPGATDRHILTNNPLSGGVNARWDASRRLRVKVLNPALYTKNQLFQTAGWIWDNQPVATDTPATFPANEAQGTDDSGTGDEDNDPYNAPDVGLLVGNDQPTIPMRHSTGANNDTFELRVQFGEFARLQVAGRWYRISDFLPWKLHVVLKRVGGLWTDNGSTAAGDNAGF